MTRQNIKIFGGYPSSVEKQVNEWLKQNRSVVTVEKWLQSESVRPHQLEQHITITIIYTDLAR